MSLICSDSRNLPPLIDETPPVSLAVTHAFTSVCNKSDVNKKKKTHKKNDVTKSNV